MSESHCLLRHLLRGGSPAECFCIAQLGMTTSALKGGAEIRPGYRPLPRKGDVLPAALVLAE